MGLKMTSTDKMLQVKGQYLFVCLFILKHFTLIEFYFKRKTIIYSFKTRLLSIYITLIFPTHIGRKLYFTDSYF